MKSLIKKLLRESLEEAIKSDHWVKDSYPDRIKDSTLKDMDPQYRVQIDKRIKDLENLEFSEEKPQKIGVWLFKTPEEVHHKPFKRRDKGNLLLAIINNNNMTTLYWKHKVEGEYDYSITYEELMEFANTKYYGGKERPITIKLLRDWKNSIKPKGDSPQVNLNKFKKLTLSDGTTVRYYHMLNKFETLEGQPIMVDDIFDKLPEDIQDKVMELLESKKNK